MIADHDLIDDVHVLNTGSGLKLSFRSRKQLQFLTFLWLFVCENLSDEVRIPVLIFTKTDGDKIESELAQKSNRLFGRCFFPRTVETNGPVSVDYWFDPMDSSNYLFFYKFFTLLEELGKKNLKQFNVFLLKYFAISKHFCCCFSKWSDKNIKLRVHVALEYSKTDLTESDKLNNCVSSGNKNTNINFFCYQTLLSFIGKYCSDDPDGQDTLQGKDVVLLGLAMLCLQQ